MRSVSRRAFLKAAVAFPAIIPASALGADGGVAPGNRVTLASIGIGPQGDGLLRGALGLPQAQVIAVCDVNARCLDAAQGRVNQQYGNKDCVAYRDFRELLQRADLDGVIIATPDHWHVSVGVAAARAGKDMYIEKPLTLSLAQGQVLRNDVQRYGRVFQYGTQQRSSREFRFACELVRNGRIGALHTIKVGAPPSVALDTPQPGPIPDWIDYDMWLGPAPWAPFSEKRLINQYWWHNSDYALGFIAGWGIHHVDIAQWGNNADATGPVEAEGRGVIPRDGFCDCAIKWNVNLRYANGVLLDYTDDGQNRHGIRFEGDRGWVHVARGLIDAEPKSLLTTVFGPDEPRLYDSRHHIGNFLDCIRSRRPTICPIETAIRSDMICHLSDIAVRLGRKVRWDPEREHFIDDAEANRMLTRAMRSPWQI